MNDPLKDFVDQHRAEFDHLDAPVFTPAQLKGKSEAVTKTKKMIPLFTVTKWLVAASVLVAITTTWVIYSNNDSAESTLVTVKKKKPAVVIAEPVASEKIKAVVSEMMPPSTKLAVALETKSKPPITRSVDVYSSLKDSTSASTRLLAILEIEKDGNINNYLLDRLALTLNHDRNTNVRLAALSLMENYRDDAHVSSLLVSSLNTQNDPMVQLGLVSILGKMKNVKIDAKLHALANNPETFAAVRDEAYNILLNQNKL